MNWLDLPIRYPSRCEICGFTGPLHECICADCLADLPVIGPVCARCGVPVSKTVDICGKCIVSNIPADRTRIAYRYGYPVDALIKQLKYKQKIRLAGPLARQLALRLQSGTDPLPEVMIPVPLHYRRQYRRGFNQAIVICQVLAGCLGIPVDTRLAGRTRNTSPMFSLNATQRKRNIAGAFTLQGRCDYRSVAIVDDVITSGSTINELARILRTAGVARIEFWALARAG